MKRGPLLARSLALLATLVLSWAAGAGSPAVAQSGRWSASVGAVVAGDPDEPYTGGSGAELAVWFVVARSVDVGGRIGTMTFDSDGLTFPQAPFLVPGEGEIVPVELALRIYPMGSGRSVFPILGLSVVVPLDDSFTAERQELPNQIGVFLDGDWEVDSVGFGAEAGVRWDASDRFFLELAGRYVVLGAESIGTVDVDPVQGPPRVVDTALDSFRVAFNIGLYF